MNTLRPLFIILFFFSVSSTANNLQAAKQSLPTGLIELDGQPALELKLNNMDGEPFDLSKSKGHWVFVHFWASGVDPADEKCRQYRICRRV